MNSQIISSEKMYIEIQILLHSVSKNVNCNKNIKGFIHVVAVNMCTIFHIF